MPTGSAADASAPPPKSRRPLVRVLGIALYLLFLLALVETASRAFWRIRYGLPFVDTRHSLTSFYAGLRRVIDDRPTRGDSTIDVLLLGGSTLNIEYGEVPQALQEQLAVATHRRVRVYRLGIPGHTSLDSYYKYRALGAARFDLVMLYDGFNEVRANNAPPGVFRDDYAHYGYYVLLRDIIDRHRLWPLATPYTIEFIVRRGLATMAARAGRPVMVPEDEPDSSWTAYGSTIRTAGPFRHNVGAILDSAAARGDPVLLATFAWYLAPGYTDQAFRARALDYATHNTPLRLWGRPGNVVAGVTAHNEVIRSLHAERPWTAFVDAAAAMPPGRTFWNDVCHFTVAGSTRFVELLLPAALATLADSTRAAAPAPGRD